MNNMQIITKIADSVAKYFGCRLKYNNQYNVIYYDGPEDCKDFIVGEANNLLSIMNFPTIDPTNVETNIEKTI